MKKKLTIKDFTPIELKDMGIPIVTWAELELKMGKREFNKLNKWMFGQTCVREGIYIHDLERFLNGLECID